MHCVILLRASLILVLHAICSACTAGIAGTACRRHVIGCQYCQGTWEQIWRRWSPWIFCCLVLEVLVPDIKMSIWTFWKHSPKFHFKVSAKYTKYTKNCRELESLQIFNCCEDHNMNLLPFSQFGWDPCHHIQGTHRFHSWPCPCCPGMHWYILVYWQMWQKELCDHTES